jgi:hypothetical protein
VRHAPWCAMGENQWRKPKCAMDFLKRTVMIAHASNARLPRDEKNLMAHGLRGARQAAVGAFGSFGDLAPMAAACHAVELVGDLSQHRAHGVGIVLYHEGADAISDCGEVMCCLVNFGIGLVTHIG